MPLSFFQKVLCFSILAEISLYAIQVNLPRGYGYVEYKKRVDAEKALIYMDGVCPQLSLSMNMHIAKSMFYLVLLLLVLQGQIDGCIIRVRFTLTQRQKASSPIKAVPAAPKKEAPPKDKVGPPAEKDAPPQPRESELLQLIEFLS